MRGDGEGGCFGDVGGCEGAETFVWGGADGVESEVGGLLD